MHTEEATGIQDGRPGPSPRVPWWGRALSVVEELCAERSLRDDSCQEAPSASGTWGHREGPQGWGRGLPGGRSVCVLTHVCAPRVERPAGRQQWGLWTGGDRPGPAQPAGREAGGKRPHSLLPASGPQWPALGHSRAGAGQPDACANWAALKGALLPRPLLPLGHGDGSPRVPSRCTALPRAVRPPLN